jgi:predicted DNA-binding transcriptional regulator AlpA
MVEVKMPSTPNNKSPVAVQLREKNSGQSVPQQQIIPKKSPRSQNTSDASLNGTSDPLGDVSFLRLPDVKLVTGLSKTSLYALIKEKSFPAPVRLGPRAVAWVRSEVRQWALERVHASRSVA